MGQEFAANGDQLRVGQQNLACISDDLVGGDVAHRIVVRMKGIDQVLDGHPR